MINFINKFTIIFYLATFIFVMGYAGAATGKLSATATSMFMKGDMQAISYAESLEGDLYKTMGHHGPAVENSWVAYRIYFNQFMSVDVLSKFKPRLELAKSRWYGSKETELSAQHFGKDNYKVGKTVGLGGIRLWDENENKVVFLDVSASTKSKRFSQVIHHQDFSKIRMTSIGVPYQGEYVDVELELTVFNDKRHAQVDVYVLTEKPLQFVTGLTVHNKLKKIEQGNNYLLTWGNYDSPAADEAFDVGAGLVFKHDDIAQRLTKPDESLVITKPLKHFQYLISSANQKENSQVNYFQGFKEYLVQLKY